MRPIAALFALVASSIAWPAPCCDALSHAPLEPQRRAPVQLAVVIHGGGVFVPVVMNDGKTYSFLLDSGFEDSVLDPALIATLHLKAGDQHTDTGPGGKVVTATVNGVQRTVGGIRLSKSRLTILDISSFAPFFGHRLDGILGYDFFSQFVVALDYQAQKLTLYDPESFPGSTEDLVPVDLERKQPYVRAGIEAADGTSATASIEIDTGKVDPFSLNLGFARSHGLFRDTSKMLAFQGVSVGGGTDAWLTRARKLTIGHFTINQPLLSIVEDKLDPVGNERSGAIGYGILKDFTVTFDYPRHAIELQRNQNRETPFEFDHAGFVLGGTGPDFDTLTVLMVIKNTPAANAGILPQDEIVNIDGQPADNFSLDQARGYFEHAVGERTLVIKRHGKLQTVRLECHRLI